MNLIITIFSSFFLILGLIAMLTPIPGGILFIAGALTGLICSSQRARSCVQWARGRADWFNNGVFWLEKKVGSRIKIVGDALAKTQPEQPDTEHQMN